MSRKSTDSDSEFELILVIPVPREDGIDPAKNQYYSLRAEDVRWRYEAISGSPGHYEKVNRDPLDPDAPDRAEWEAFIERDVDMAHKSDMPRPFGTFLVNLASFFNKKRT